MSIHKVAFLALSCIVGCWSVAQSAEPIAWRSNYRAAVAEARASGAMAFVWFFDPGRQDENNSLEREVIASSAVANRLSAYVLVRLPLDAPLPAAEPSARPATRLVDHPAFAELSGGAGLAIIDLRDERSPHYSRVISIYPLAHRRITADELAALLALPTGSLTQRTLIWAVWTNVERPQSASAETSPQLLAEAASHAQHQANIQVPGHHDWEARFHRINARLPASLVAQEICAESWPGQTLVDAAEECVRSWRHSSGHWDAVRSRHPQFGYDMKRGANGIWYATGIFGRQRH